MGTRPAEPATKGGTVVAGKYWRGRQKPPTEKPSQPPSPFRKGPDKAAPPLGDGGLAAFKDSVHQLERRVEVLEAQEGPEPWHDSATDFLPSMDGSPGIVVDEGVARATPCTRFDLGEGKELMFSKGVVGGLDEGQKALFCPEVVTKPLSEAQRQRLQAWRESAAVCKVEIADVPKGEQLPPWLACMSRELNARGVELK